MARTITEIQNEIIAAKNADATLSNLSSASATAVWRLWTRVVASAIWVLENMFDTHKADVEALIAELKPSSLRWYQEMALKFQFGSDLPDGEIYYDNSALGVDTIAAQQIIAQAAAEDNNGTLIVKIAREVSGELEPLTSAQYDAFEAYINEVKDAGVSVAVRNTNADKLKIEADIYYDPQVLNNSGQRLDGTNNTPVQDAIKAYLRALPFNGTFVKSKLVDAMQAVEGVYVPEARLVQAARYDSSTFTTVDIQYNPYSGFLRIYDDNTDLILTFTSQDDV